MIDMKLIEELTLLDKKNKVQRALKVSEEAGELAAAVLSETDAPGCEYKTLGREEVLEEIADVLIITSSMAAHYKFLESEVKAKILEKCEKWKKVIS